MLFLHNRQGVSENSICTNLEGADWVLIQNSKFRSDHREPSMRFRSDHTEPSVQFRSDHTDPSVQLRKANTDPSMQFRWGHTEFLFCKMLAKNLDESVRQLSHLQTSPCACTHSVLCPYGSFAGMRVRQAQARAPVRMHSVRAYVMQFHTVILEKCHLKFGNHI